MGYRAGDTWTKYFATQNAGAAADADSTPTVTAAKNGTDDTGGGSFTAAITVTNIETGIYKASGVIPSTYEPGDQVTVRVAATVSSTAGKAILDDFILDAGLSIIGEIDDGSATASSFDGDSGLSSTDDAYNGMFLVPTSGALAGIARKISDYDGTNKTFTFFEAFPSTPANGTTFEIVGRSE